MNNKERKHNNYGLYMLNNHLAFLKKKRPIIYKIINESGKTKSTHFHERMLKYYGKNGIIAIGDLEEEIKEYEARISYLKTKN